MKPIKPKKMPKALEKTLAIRAEGSAQGAVLSRAAVRSILAALAYERQRAEEAEARAHVLDHVAQITKEQARGTPAPDDHHVHLQVRGFHVEPVGEFTTQMGHNVTETPAGYVVTPDFQREQTEAVVPKPRKYPEIEASYARERNIARRKKLTAP